MKNTILTMIIFAIMIFSSCDDNRFNVPWIYMENSSKCTMSKIIINSINGRKIGGEKVINSYNEDFSKVPSMSYNSITYTCTCEGKSTDYHQDFTPIELEQFEKYKIVLDCSNSFINQISKIKK